MRVYIDEYPDCVIVAGQYVARPKSVSRGDWLAFWDRVKKISQRG